MHYWKQYAEIDLDAPKIMILISKECSGASKKFEDKELKALLHKDSCQTLAEFAESLGVSYNNNFETFESIRNESKARKLATNTN